MPLVIVLPAPNTTFNVDATPRMPTIQCQARITGVQPDPTPTTGFNWTIEITETVASSSCASARVGSCTQRVTQQTVRGGNWTPQFTAIQGGDATITVEVPQPGGALRTSVNARIRGTNPAAGSITMRVGGAGSTGDRIACHESGRRQFDGAGMPLLGPGGDVGVMQLCNPGASCLQRWSWTANVDGGLALLRQKATEARTYLNQYVVNGHYQNDQSMSDADVLEYETIQRYNTRAGYWSWNGTARRWQANPPNTYVADVLACR